MKLKQSEETKIIALEILLYLKRKKEKKEIIDRIIKDRMIRDIWKLLETEEEKKERKKLEKKIN